jgi:hypothetical protein
VRDRQDKKQKIRSSFCENNVNHKLSDIRGFRITPGGVVKGKGSLFPTRARAK